MSSRSNRYNQSSGNGTLHSGYDMSRREIPVTTSASEGMSRVEQRLRILKSSRVRWTTDTQGETLDPSPQPSVSSIPTAVEPPCATYPAFDLARLSKHEQHIVDALLAEVVDAVAFPSVQDDLAQ
ncbi:hypothetical protein C3747_91g333c [Trypanosoma cruzi]|uniref:Uncharacterized protein n=2 Tax=Trypanosoma cruzi TaxID=5693 RepID=Q4CX09_TRYCC|nr:hypothetical protein, conserved [Trypanosoma cruzi]EAN84813.1 hypothetical protein, conserved [Trypanosoma cruzi]PWV08347.1 hypothetical protein C3747_91g333c [Trypanosoma cruzi]RNC55609.1 hypothetical protein TcCL_ESM06877 [Trypanosoma cruzi]|eukprot:XP_806664.1 hypothetical protein [Trypanosoma cruzi strain CL Brener]